MTSPGQHAQTGSAAVTRAGASGPPQQRQAAHPRSPLTFPLVALYVAGQVLRSRRFYAWLAVGAVAAVAAGQVGKENQASAFARLAAWNEHELHRLEARAQRHAQRLESQAKRAIDRAS